MTKGSPKSTNVEDMIFAHSDEAEYVAYLTGLPMDESFRRKRLEYRANFIAQWPDPKAWFSEPMPVRIGCLTGDSQDAGRNHHTRARRRPSARLLPMFREEWEDYAPVPYLRGVSHLAPGRPLLGVHGLRALGARG